MRPLFGYTHYLTMHGRGGAKIGGYGDGAAPKKFLRLFRESGREVGRLCLPTLCQGVIATASDIGITRFGDLPHVHTIQAIS